MKELELTHLNIISDQEIILKNKEIGTLRIFLNKDSNDMEVDNDVENLPSTNLTLRRSPPNLTQLNT